jgi:hypothetical protein
MTGFINAMLVHDEVKDIVQSRQKARWRFYTLRALDHVTPVGLKWIGQLQRAQRRSRYE